MAPSHPRGCDWPTPAVSKPLGRAVGRAVALRLSDYFRPALRAHFAALGEDDLHLRFGAHCRPEVLDAYVAGIDFQRSVVLGVFDDSLRIVGTAHLSSAGTSWELGLSVLADNRNQGIGGLLLRRAIQQARLAGADRLSIHCLADNHALMRLVRKVGCRVVEREGESDGVIWVPRNRPLPGLAELADDQVAAFDFGLKAHILMWRLWTGAAWPDGIFALLR